jgi:hypothetical protein
LEPPMQRAVADIATAAGAVTSPWWLDALHQGYQGFMAGGAAILLGLRLAVAYREWRQGKKP